MKSKVLVRKSVTPIAIGAESPEVAATEALGKRNLSYTKASEKHLCEGTTKQGMMRNMISRLVVVMLSGLLVAPLVMFGVAGKVKPAVGPTAESALAADQELARALQANDTVGIYRMLDKDWAVIPSNGDVDEGPSVFPGGIRSGARTVTKMALSEPRVRMYGHIALVTSKVELAVSMHRKGEAPGTWSGQLRQTDVWRWKNGVWKCILTQEAKISG